MPTVRQIEMKQKEIQSYVNYRFNDDDVDFIVKEKKRFAKDNGKIAEKKIELNKERTKALDANDLERVKRLIYLFLFGTYFFLLIVFLNLIMSCSVWPNSNGIT